MPRRATILIPAGLLLLAHATPCYAQHDSDCTALLKQGIYNHITSSTSMNRAAAAQSAICESYNHYQSDITSGHVAAHYGIGGGEVNLSRDQIEAIGRTMCANSSSSDSAQQLVSSSSALIDTAAVQAWQSCVNNHTRGLFPTFNFGLDLAQASISLEYVPSTGGAHTLHIDGVVISPAEAFTCSGPLWNARNGADLQANTSFAISCRRKISASAQVIPGSSTRAFAPAASVEVQTSAGTVRTDVPALTPQAPPSPVQFPIGTIISYAGNLVPGSMPTGWLLCDGSSFPRSKFPELYKVIGGTYGSQPSDEDVFRVPDYRGMFLRGQDPNASVDTGAADRITPSGARGAVIGSIQLSHVGSHTHTASTTISPNPHHHGFVAPAGKGGSEQPGGQGLEPANTTETTLSAATTVNASDGKAETWPNNVYVNFLIRAL